MKITNGPKLTTSLQPTNVSTSQDPTEQPKKTKERGLLYRTFIYDDSKDAGPDGPIKWLISLAGIGIGAGSIFWLLAMKDIGDRKAIEQSTHLEPNKTVQVDNSK